MNMFITYKCVQVIKYPSHIMYAYNIHVYTLVDILYRNMYFLTGSNSSVYKSRVHVYRCYQELCILYNQPQLYPRQVFIVSVNTIKPR